MKNKLVKIGITLIVIGLLIALYMNFGDVIFDQTHDINQEAEHSMSGIQTIKIQSLTTDIHIHTADYEDFFATFKGQIKSPTKKAVPLLKAKQEDGILFVDITYTSYDIHSVKNMTFDVYLPVNFRGNIEILTDASSINIPSVKLNSLICITTTGNISTRPLDVDNIILSSITGNIDTSLNMDTELPITIDTVSGSINSDYKHEVDTTHKFLTTSGDIHIKSNN